MKMIQNGLIVKYKDDEFDFIITDPPWGIGIGDVDILDQR